MNYVVPCIRGFSIFVLLFCTIARAAPLSLETFATPETITDVAISPDGRYVAVVSAVDDHRVAFVMDRSTPRSTPVRVLADTENNFEIAGCNWATNTRLVCSYRGATWVPTTYVTLTRLVAVDADGNNRLVLLQQSTPGGNGEFQVKVIGWRTDTPDTILVAADESTLGSASRGALSGRGAVLGKTNSGYPAVFELNVVTGKTRRVLQSRAPIFGYIADSSGQPRFAYGARYGSKAVEYFARPIVNRGWQRLEKSTAFAQRSNLVPVALNPDDPNLVYAFGPAQGRDALWSIDLTDAKAPELVYANEQVDIRGGVVFKDGWLVGITYETELPHTYYIDAQIGKWMQGVDAALPDTFNTIVDATADRSLLIIRAISDTVPGTYYVFDTKAFALEPMVQNHSDLKRASLGRTRPIRYSARDDTAIPGYLTKPSSEYSEPLPLIVMPHEGPLTRSRWEYSFLRQFLVNRGYAVFEPNFRGSWGYGYDWFRAARRDWSGLIYDDTVDGVQWLIKNGVADPHRIAIMGARFGGYMALVGAVRNSDLFKCAISISGVTDLALLDRWISNYANVSATDEGAVGKEFRIDSLPRYADKIQSDVLLIHAEKSPSVPIEQSKAMADALARANKRHELVIIEGADDRIDNKAERMVLLTALEKTLNTCLSNSGVH